MSLLGCCSCWVLARVPSMCAGASWLAVGLLRIPFIRVYLREEMDRVQAGIPGAEQPVCVDDISQEAVGTMDAVVGALVEGGIRFRDAINRLHLRVSPKSVIVASDMKVANAIQSELHQCGICVQVARTARDLGLCLNPSGRRSTAGRQAKRLKSASVRLVRTAGLVKVVRGARKLVTTGSFPQALWGHVSQGIAPTVLGRFRAQVAAATGICQPGRCRTTAIALAFGQGSDTAIKVAREQVSSWLSLWEGCPELRGDVRVAWVFHSERVIGERGPGWNKVTGPMIATIATLHNYGWKAGCPDVWTGSDGCSRTINAGSGIKGVADMVAGSVADHFWKVASVFWCSGGLAEGLDTSATLGYVP